MDMESRFKKLKLRIESNYKIESTTIVKAIKKPC